MTNGMRTAKEIHNALDSIKENTLPHELVSEISDFDLGVIGNILVSVELLAALQARALALILEKLEEEAGEA